MTSSQQPVLAIVIPIYGHPSLLIDALESALRQQTSHDYRIILVNDGCPSPQTDRVCRQYAQVHPRRILYLHKRNGRMSSARNRGLQVALEAWPSIRAFYFLDADNRLHPHVLERAYAQLQASPEAAWVFPDVHMFGSSRIFCDTQGEFSRLQLLAANYCEQGSLVRREVFEAGVFFDETMTLGYEDWEFWLHSLAAGFKGRHVPALGFLYRKRPESMLANSDRDREQILGYMRRKHAQLYTPRCAKRYEQEEMPRFALYLADRAELVLTSDVRDLRRRCNWAEFVRAMRRNSTCGQLQAVSPTVVVTTSVTLELLTQRGIAANILWTLEADLQDHSLFVLNVEQHLGIDVRYELSKPFSPSAQDRGESVLCALRTTLLAEELNEPHSQPFASFQANTKGLIARRLRLEHLQTPEPLAGNAVKQLSDLITAHAPAYAGAPSRRLNPRRHCFRTPSDAGLISQRLFQTPAAPPLSLGVNERHIGFVAPIAEFGGVERIVCNMAREMKRHGWHPHLFILGTGLACLLAEFSYTFESVHLLPDEDLLKPARLVGLLGLMDVVVNNQSVYLNAAQGDLKRLGVKIVSHVQIVDLTTDAVPCGHPYLAAEYEHSLHKLQVPSVSLRDFMLAKAIPPEKLLLVPNAPSFEVPPERIETALAERAGRPKTQPLRVLFMARFDRQKGLDRLAHLVRESERRLPDVAWRIVGKPILNDAVHSTADLKRLLDKHLHPPAMDAQALCRHYCWADVLVLLSRFEGAPLSILEAQQLGCVPIATQLRRDERVDRGWRDRVLAREHSRHRGDHEPSTGAF